MTPADMNTLQVLDSILRENLGNRLTAALVNGIVNTLHDHINARPPMPGVMSPSTPTPNATDGAKT